MKTFQSLASTAMFAIMVFGLPLFFINTEPGGVPTTDPEIVAQLDARIEKNRQSPVAQMTREPIGYFDENLKWVPVPFDRTANAR